MNAVNVEEDVWEDGSLWFAGEPGPEVRPRAAILLPQATREPPSSSGGPWPRAPLSWKVRPEWVQRCLDPLHGAGVHCHSVSMGADAVPRFVHVIPPQPGPVPAITARVSCMWDNREAGLKHQACG